MLESIEAAIRAFRARAGQARQGGIKLDPKKHRTERAFSFAEATAYENCAVALNQLKPALAQDFVAELRVLLASYSTPLRIVVPQEGAFESCVFSTEEQPIPPPAVHALIAKYEKLVG